MLLLFSISTVTLAQNNTSYEIDEHIIYYNVFNSTIIPAEVAQAYNLVRAKDRVYVNVALVKKSGGNGIAANITGSHRNLMQQKIPLEFIEIKEATATYYLAPIRFNNEEILHIDITATSLDNSDTGSFTITKKLYKD
ncbi:MAG: DUF4426 domain-containing protein [Cellvibrionaceae bacterium]